MKVVWMPSAVADLSEIRRYIARSRPKTATRIVRLLRARARKLAELPEQGRVVLEIRDPAVREIVVSRYRLVYFVLVERVEILRVIDSARLLTGDEVHEDAASYGASPLEP